jgi:deoxyribodipyrimidine photo-lyase
MKLAIFWYRRDLRLTDNAGLYHALRSGYTVLPLFIFDKEILDRLEKKDARVDFIHDTIADMHAQFAQLGISFLVEYGHPMEIWQKIIEKHEIAAVFTNHDYEKYALSRDASVRNLLAEKNIAFHTYKDHVIFEGKEVTKDDGLPYTVFTPYSKKWRAKLESHIENITNADGSTEAISFYLKPYPTEKYFQAFLKNPILPLPTLSEMGFERSNIAFPSISVAQSIIKNYDATRDFPAIIGTSRLGIHFRFGTISVREKLRKALTINQIYVNELIWRDFYAMILQHFPHVATQPFRPEYDRIEWVNNETDFQKWCTGRTGYSLVDAGMRELNATGYMHNRVRMLVASFLTKHLLIDWRWGEAYFAQKLLDFDLASNNGGWQWAAGCGTDAAPYFRIFSPASQQEKFDKDYKYVRRWVAEYGTPHYPKPMIDHAFARERCLKVYKAALKRGGEEHLKS